MKRDNVDFMVGWLDALRATTGSVRPGLSSAGDRSRALIEI
jgi:hypothetical protein